MEPTYSTRWLYHHHTTHEVAPGRHTCAVCGLSCDQGAPTHSVIRPTFTDYAALRAPNAPTVCHACEWYMANQSVRRESWWLTAQACQIVAKGAWHDLLLAHVAQPPTADSYYLITTMKRKHLALYAPLNTAHSPARRVRFEVSTLELDPAAWPTLVHAAHSLRAQHGWKEIHADSYNSFFVARNWPDIARFAALRATVKPYLYTPYLDLAQFVWSNEPEPTGDDNEDE